MIHIKQSVTFQKWMHNLKDRQARIIIDERINRLSKGLPGDVKPIGQGISELRIHQGSGWRIYYMQRKKTLIILLCGGKKSTQAKDIAAAKQIAADWSEE